MKLIFNFYSATTKFFFLTFLVSILFTFSLYSQDNARLLRFPNIHGNQIVFSFAGDLYLVSSEGGMARKITSDIGYEMFARFSPDGKYIAFTGQYDGNTEVFVMPSEGGSPKRLTYTATLSRDDVSDRMGPNNIVMEWTPDSKFVIYRSRKQTFNDFKGSLFKVSIEGGLSEQLPLSYAGFCSYSPDGTKLAFNEVFREFRTWKYYKGGMADDIRIMDLKTHEITKITNDNTQDVFPMWINNKIWFLSDRDRRMNIFSYDVNTKKTEKVTSYEDYDVKFPSSGGNFIVYEKGGYIYKLNTEDGSNTLVNIRIANDEPMARAEIKDVSKSIRSVDLSPNGERLVFAARGEVFNLPAEKGVTFNLTQSPGIHERNVNWSPDGKFIAYLSDKSGEFEIYIQKSDRSDPAKQLTSGADSYIFNLLWSPDSKKILYNDRMLRLTYIDIETGKTTMVETAKYNIPNSYCWSPDSKWIAYDYTDQNDFSIIKLYKTANRQTFEVTNSWYDSSNPQFSKDGKYLYFVSDRDFSPIYSSTEWNHAYQDMSKIFLVTLANDTPSPFAPKNPELKADEPEESEKEKTTAKSKNADKDKKKDVKPEVPNVKIDIEGIGDRIIALPIGASNYFNLQEAAGKLYYIDYLREKGSMAKVFDLEKKKEIELGKNLYFTLAGNGKKMLVSSEGKFSVIDIPTATVNITEPIDLSGMKAKVDYPAEWKQIFDESWRQMRDFFYVPNMHGVDWIEMKEKYGQLVPYVKTRDDLTYIIGEMIGELSIGHAYINSGEKPKPERIKTGLLGAKLSKSPSGYFRIEDILKGANWNKELRSPLTEPGLNIKEGDYIIAVDANSTKDVNDIYSLLIGKVDMNLELTINNRPEPEGSRKVIISPIEDESHLYYYRWVQKNIDYVNKKTNGQIGYIHIPDMGPEGLNEFAKHFYPQLNKKGLIIDDRGNGGGNVSPMIIERLKRSVTRSTMRRNIAEGRAVPGQMMLGPKVLLIDKYSASDGDLFPYSFEKNKMGTVIGTRSWGGVVGITGSLPFIDGQDLRKPEFASYSSEESKWIIEGYGVDPDIHIENNLYDEFKGEDAQLDKAIEVILNQMKEQYKPVPPIPEAPDKSK